MCFSTKYSLLIPSPILFHIHNIIFKMAKKFKAQKLGIEINIKVFEDRIYLLFPQPLFKGIFIKALSGKGILISEIPRSDWLKMEIIDDSMPKEPEAKEQYLSDYIIKELSKGGFEIIIEQ